MDPIKNTRQQPVSIRQENTAASPTILQTSDHDETYYLRGAGRTCPQNPKYVLLIMDNTRRHNVLLIAVGTDERVDVKDAAGLLEFSMVRESNIVNVVKNGEEVGIITLKRHRSEMVITNTSPYEYITCRGMFNCGALSVTIFNGSPDELGSFNNNSPAVMKISFKRLISVAQKMMLLALTITEALTFKAIYKHNLFVKMSCLNPNSEELETRQETTVAPGPQSEFVFSQKNLSLRLAGHNSSKNIVYYELYAEKVALTLECTPLENFRGFVRLTARTEFGEAIFHAVNFQADGTLAIYSVSGALIGYQAGEGFYDNCDNIHMKMTQTEIEEKYENKLGRNLEFNICSTSTNRFIALIRRNPFTVSLFLPKRIYQLQRFAIIAAFALKAHCETYGFDKQPHPEISYHYRATAETAQFIVED